MIRINNYQIDLVLQTEEHTSISKVLNSLTLDVNEILIICPEVFLQRFIQHFHEDLTGSVIDEIDKSLKTSNGFVSIMLSYKNKMFDFHFIILSNEVKNVHNPFKGAQEFNVAFKEIKIN